MKMDADIKALMKTKIGRPKLNKDQNRMSLSFSDNAWAIMKLVKPGVRSQLVSLLLVDYAKCFPTFFKGDSHAKNSRNTSR